MAGAYRMTNTQMVIQALTERGSLTPSGIAKFSGLTGRALNGTIAALERRKKIVSESVRDAEEKLYSLKAG